MYIINLLIWFILGPDRNSGPVPVPVEFGWYWFRSVPIDLAGTRPVQIFFHVVFRFYDELPGSRAPLQFPDCITCYPPVSRLHHVLSSSSQTVSRATLEFTKCIMPPPPPHLATLGEEYYLYFHRLLLLLISH